jgi:hypothetical protein
MCYYPLAFLSFAISTFSSLLSHIILCHHSSLLLPQTMDYFETHGGYDKDIKYSEENKFLELGEGTLCPPKIVVTNTKILHLVFVGTCEHHILNFFCSFQVFALVLT